MPTRQGLKAGCRGAWQAQAHSCPHLGPRHRLLSHALQPVVARVHGHPLNPGSLRAQAAASGSNAGMLVSSLRPAPPTPAPRPHNAGLRDGAGVVATWVGTPLQCPKASRRDCLAQDKAQLAFGRKEPRPASRSTARMCCQSWSTTASLKEGHARARNLLTGCLDAWRPRQCFRLSACLPSHLTQARAHSCHVAGHAGIPLQRTLFRRALPPQRVSSWRRSNAPVRLLALGDGLGGVGRHGTHAPLGHGALHHLLLVLLRSTREAKQARQPHPQTGVVKGCSEGLPQASHCCHPRACGQDGFKGTEHVQKLQAPHQPGQLLPPPTPPKPCAPPRL